MTIFREPLTGVGDEICRELDAPTELPKYQKFLGAIQDITGIVGSLDCLLQIIRSPNGPHAISEGLDLPDFSLMKLLEEGPAIIREITKTCHDRIDQLRKEILE